jgi:hypothetical protein
MHKGIPFAAGLVLLLAGAFARLFYAQNAYEVGEPIFQAAGIVGLVLLAAAAVCLVFAYRGLGPHGRRLRWVFTIVLVVWVVLLAGSYSLIRYQTSEREISMLEHLYSAPIRPGGYVDVLGFEQDERKLANAAWWVSSSRREAVLDLMQKRRAEYLHQLHQSQQR